MEHVRIASTKQLPRRILQEIRIRNCHERDAVSQQVHEWNEDANTIKSKMEIDPATQMDAGYYECQADNKYAVDVKGFRTDYLIVFD